MIVPNTIVTDARVLKQADTLAAAGHLVRVCGLIGTSITPGAASRDSGVELFWSDHRAKTANFWRIFGKLAKLALVVATYFLFFAVVIGNSVLIAEWFAAVFGNGTWFSEVHKQGLAAIVSVFIAGGMCIPERRIARFFQLAFSATFLLWIVYRATTDVVAPFLGTLVPAWATLVLIGGIGAVIARLFARFVRFSNSYSTNDKSSPEIHDKFIEATKLKFAGPLWRRMIGTSLITPAVAFRPDIVHCHDLLSLWAGTKIKERTGAKLVFDAHEIYEEVAQSDEKTKRMWHRTLKRYSDKVDVFITINTSIAEYYAQNHPKLPAALIIKNAAVPAEPFEYDGRMHRAAGLPPSQKILLYQGGFARKRGLERLIEASRFLGPEWTLVMMGWGSIERQLRERAAAVAADVDAHRSNPVIRFIDPAPQQDLVFWSAGATIGAIPYENTGLNHLYCTPNKLWEYPNAGVPILVSPLEEMSKVINRYRIGWFLPADLAPPAIAGVVNGLSEDEIAEARRACGPYMAEDGWPKYGARLTKIYDALAGPGMLQSGSRADFAALIKPLNELGAPPSRRAYDQALSIGKGA